VPHPSRLSFSGWSRTAYSAYLRSAFRLSARSSSGLQLSRGYRRGREVLRHFLETLRDQHRERSDLGLRSGELHADLLVRVKDE
jgi:hypothetical protein